MLADRAVAYLKECGLYVTSVQVEKLASAEVIQAVTEYCPNVRVFETHRLSEEIIELLNQRRIERFDFTLSDFVSDILEPQSLRKLVINWLQGRSTAMVYTFVRRCPELTHFSLRFASLLMEIPDPSLFPHFPKLVALNFHSPLIDDGTLSNIADLCPLIEHLDLRGNIRITDSGLYTAATKLKLKTIAINGTSKNITDRGLMLLKHCVSSLMEVHIAQAAGFRVSGKSKITQSAITTLLSSIHLTLFDWRCRIMFTVYSHDLSVCACATTIVVSVAATDRSVAKYCPQLQHLNIVLTGGVQVPQYTSAGLYTVIHSCPLLQSIRVNTNIDRMEFGEILILHKELFVFSTSNVEFLYDVMDM